MIIKHKDETCEFYVANSLPQVDVIIMYDKLNTREPNVGIVIDTDISFDISKIEFCNVKDANQHAATTANVYIDSKFTPNEPPEYRHVTANLKHTIIVDSNTRQQIIFVNNNNRWQVALCFDWILIQTTNNDYFLAKLAIKNVREEYLLEHVE